MKQDVYFLKVRSPSGQWRTTKSFSIDEHEKQKEGFINFQWEVKEEYVKSVPIINQLKLEL